MIKRSGLPDYLYVVTVPAQMGRHRRNQWARWLSDVGLRNQYIPLGSKIVVDSRRKTVTVRVRGADRRWKFIERSVRLPIPAPPGLPPEKWSVNQAPAPDPLTL